MGIENPERKIFGLQYHPEVVHSERGAETIRCGCAGGRWLGGTLLGWRMGVSSEAEDAHGQAGSQAFVLRPPRLCELLPSCCLQTLLLAELLPRAPHVLPADATALLLPRTRRHFLFDIAQMSGDWKMENVLEEEMEKIRSQVGGRGRSRGQRSPDSSAAGAWRASSRWLARRPPEREAGQRCELARAQAGPCMRAPTLPIL